MGYLQKKLGYTKFITQGAKKYAYISKEDYKIHITVAGVPKEGAKALKSLEDFKNNFVFSFKDTGKNLIIYNDNMESFDLKDYKGNTLKVDEKYACVLIPTTYELGKSEDYEFLIKEQSSKRAEYKEE